MSFSSSQVSSTLVFKLASATEMMPCLHNYITVDTPAFLANPKNLELIYNMCKKVFMCECVPSEYFLITTLYRPHFVWFEIAEIPLTKKQTTYMYIVGYLLFIDGKQGRLHLL